MIKINLFNQADFDKILAVKAATDAFFAQRETLSFSGRHPELLSMFNCGVCGRRHRRSHTCAQNYVKEAEGIRGPKIRHNRHRNAWGLQVLERATAIYREFKEVCIVKTQEEDDELGKHSLSMALNSKRAERAARRRKLHLITRESRQINREA
jgi:hypothetical protein